MVLALLVIILFICVFWCFYRISDQDETDYEDKIIKAERCLVIDGRVVEGLILGTVQYSLMLNKSVFMDTGSYHLPKLKENLQEKGLEIINIKHQRIQSYYCDKTYYSGYFGQIVPSFVKFKEYFQDYKHPTKTEVEYLEMVAEHEDLNLISWLKQVTKFEEHNG